MGEKQVFFKRQQGDSEELAVLKQSLEATRKEIAQAYGWFNAADDPDLIDSYVYQINSLRARYNYLLRRIKSMDANASIAAAGGDGEKQWV